MGFPTAPAFGILRLANLRDVPRIASISTAGFYYSPVLASERRFSREFPLDTLQSYEKMFADTILSPEHVALVVEDSCDPSEAEKPEVIIQPDREVPRLRQGDPAVVAMATWKLEPGYPRRGQSIAPEDCSSPKHDFDGGPGRDKSPHHAEMLDEKCDSVEDRQVFVILEILAISPSLTSRVDSSEDTNLWTYWWFILRIGSVVMARLSWNGARPWRTWIALTKM
ncbi:hypothetical protein QQZ08_002749 [Neonectria magnoliae]|uniref:N-acetyltransferase domain-containing protein n=1 Tax=Neonectria magnoliae TaxID=2732573 RepID=A0ABR1IB64_9HYPO